ncbi:DUF551 domain-containing protein [Serratia liquefaciens]|uniref:DUF551 domain-containing protein n=1 Tax=Serratia liquefaciens TaxID=614 RepID=UPI003D019D3E
MKKASTEDLRIFLMEVTDEIGSAHPETRDTKISARLLRDILTELLANREAQPVAEVLSSRSGNDTSTIDKALPAGTKLYTAPPAPAVPGKITPSQAQALCPSKYYVMNGDELNVAADFWNACRAAMLAQPVTQGCNWIACGEQLPAVGETVLVSSDGYVSVGESERSGANYRYFTSVATGRELTVTHWMPLPAAPEGGSDPDTRR